MAYTYDDLASDIGKLTPEERRQPVLFMEPYDDPAVVAADHLVIAHKDITSNDEVLVKNGGVYLE